MSLKRDGKSYLALSVKVVMFEKFMASNSY